MSHPLSANEPSRNYSEYCVRPLQDHFQDRFHEQFRDLLGHTLLGLVCLSGHWNCCRLTEEGRLSLGVPSAFGDLYVQLL